MSDHLVDSPEAEISIQLPSVTRLSGEGYKFGLRGHPSFCSVCTNFDHAVASELFNGDPERGLYLHELCDGVSVHVQYGDIVEAAENGCSSCLLLREVLNAFHWGDVLKKDPPGEVRVTYLEGTTMTVATVDEEGNYINLIELFTDQDSRSPWPTIGPLIHTIDPRISTPPWVGGVAKRVPLDPDSDECYGTIRSWMRHCEQEHPWCDIQSSWHATNRPERPSSPRRLIYVGGDPGPLSLSETKQLHSAPTYTALSYCWGSRQSLVALTSNIDKLKISIEFESLAKSCQDAVTITRRLGFEYLWIDALCIIQDDPLDWQSESGIMGSIYANAYLCIAATAAGTSGTGIFQPRAYTKTVSLTDVDGRTSRLYIRKEIPHTAFDWRISDPAGNDFELSEGARSRFPLFKRGWTFQERLLSLRILHYTQSEMVWECLGSTTCECGTLDQYTGSTILRERKYVTSVPRDIEVRCNKLDRVREQAKRRGFTRSEGTSGRFDFAMQRDYTLWLLYSDDTRKPEEEKLHAGDRWHSLVTEYSRRALTYPTDALPALSGLAEKWSTLNGSANRYLAGLWENNLQRDLLWRYRDVSQVDRPENYLAPTWSWASNRRTVDWIAAFYNSIYHTTILETACPPSSSNPFGTVERGLLKLYGPVLHGSIKISHNLEQSSLARVQFEETSQKYQHFFHVDCIPECAQLEGKTATVLRFCTDIQDTTTQQGVDRGLVLLEDASTNDAIYTRIGVMERLDADVLFGWQLKVITVV